MIPWLETLGDFPHSDLALTHHDGADGLLCASIDLNTSILKKAYLRGIYPWYNAGEPVLWWTPSQRAVLFCNEFKLHKSLRKTLLKYQSEGNLSVSINTACEQVMLHCANRPQGTWMTPELCQTYLEWHHQGYVHSIETWLDNKLVGGFYGVAIGRMFFGESMFSHINDASKIAFASFISWFMTEGGDIIDCQQDTAHLLSLGARTISRQEFEGLIKERCSYKEPIQFKPIKDNPPLNLLKGLVL